MKLKYGMNPYQKNAEIILNDNLQVINGNPSLINFLDGLNAWQLVKELAEATKLSSATSFKHVTPSGAAVSGSIKQKELISYNFLTIPESSLTEAYLKARGSDRLASFGDFIGLSETVDIQTAKLIKTEVSDGIIAPDYTSEALELLKTKKNGNYCILKINKDYTPKISENRELFGFQLFQDRNNLKITEDNLTNIKTKNTNIDSKVVQNIIVGMITLKYTQSNSIAVIQNSHVVGIGSGQQSRILCSNLALTKANKWYQKTKIDYSDIIYPDSKMTKTVKDNYHDQVRENTFGDNILLNELPDLCLCSDGFFPHIDNIELAHQYGVKCIAAPMGSIRDNDIIEICNKLGITFIDTGVRLFHH